jgi:hypothetical protein
MPDFNSAELAMRRIVRIDSDKIKFSINRKKIFDDEKATDNKILISSLPYSSSTSFPVATLNTVKDGEEEYKFKESCNILISCTNKETSKKISALLRSFGATSLKQIKY